MLLKRVALLGALLILAVSVGSLSAQEGGEETAEVQEWYWPEAGLRLEYPTGWQPNINDANFDFALFEEVEGAVQFVGLQMQAVPANEELSTIVESLTGGGELTAEETELDGLPAFRIEVPAGDNGQQGFVVAFKPSSDVVALLIAFGPESNWEAFAAQAEAVVASADITPLELDIEALNQQLQTSLQDEGILRLGEAEASVQVVEGLDFSCGHCVDYSSSVKRLISDYVQTGQVSYELLLVTFVGAEFSEAATHAQYCAADQGFGWEMHLLLFDGYKENGGAQFYTPGNIIGAVEEAALTEDLDAFTTCLAERPFTEAIEASAARAEEYGIQSTPSLLFAAAGEQPAFITDTNGQAARGGLRLIHVYEHLDSLLGE